MASCRATVATEDTDAPLVDTGDEVAVEAEPEKVMTMLQAMTVPQRLKLAMKGSREQRAVLVRDPNRMIAAAVLSSPKLAQTEVEAFARMANVSEDVLRTISMNRSWMRKLAVAAALVKNPKTPAAISLHLLPRMTQRDVKQLCDRPQRARVAPPQRQEDDAAAAGPAEVAAFAALASRMPLRRARASAARRLGFLGRGPSTLAAAPLLAHLGQAFHVDGGALAVVFRSAAS